MNEKLIKCFTNPLKCKLFFDVEAMGEATAKELSRRNKEIPQATLYRHLRKMIDDGVLTVVREKQVRNVSEKIYAVGLDFKSEVDKLVADNSGKAYVALFKQFCHGLIGEFQAYGDRDDIDILNDGSGFRVVPFYATFDELKELAEKLRDIIKPYHENEHTPDRQMRNIAIVYTPPTAE